MEPQPSVLIVDDMTDARIMLRLMLSRLGGYQTLEATNGQEAIQQAAAHRPDVIVLDYMMPDLDGAAVCSQLRQMPSTKDVLILVLTARTDSDTRQKVLQAGANQFMNKPVQPRELLQSVQALLATRGNMQPAVNSGA
ncbi:MAG: response regulator [Anaerolineae bacterium]|nr:response regulator [Anaerolineae bacterium]